MTTTLPRRIAAAILPFCALLPLLSPGSGAPPQDPVPAAAPPAPEHAWLRQLAGSWRADGNDATTAELRPVGGYHVLADLRAKVMGTAYEARLLLGYCPLERCCFAVQVDSLAPTPTRLEGACDLDAGVLTLRGSCPSPDGARAPCVLRLAIVDEHRFTYSLAAVAADGSERPLGAVAYRRSAPDHHRGGAAAGADR